ncbi:MAG: hypothetical protein ACYDB7_04910 [Mycobacteriales bacterium]
MTARRPHQALTFAVEKDAASAQPGSVWVASEVPLVVACRFGHESKVSRYGLGSVSGERVKRELVECLLSMSDPDRGVGSSPTVGGYVVAIRAFLRFIEGDGDAAAGLAGLDAGVLDRFQEGMLARYGAESGEPSTLVNRVCGLLREAVEEHGVTLGAELRRRMLFGATCAKPASTPRDAYTPTEVQAILEAARVDVARVTRRLLVDGPALLAAGGPPDRAGGGWKSKANIAWYLDHYGDRTIDQLREESGGNYVLSGVNSVPPTTVRPLLWPTVRDLVGFWVLLLAQSGLTPAAAAMLTTDCLTNASAGKVTIRHHKHRAGRSRSERAARVQDGSTAPGGVIRALLRITERARPWVDSDALWVAIKDKQGFTVHATREFRIRNGSKSPLAQFAIDHDLVWQDGAAGAADRLVLHGSRLRKSYVAAAYRAVGGDIPATARAAGNTGPVAMRHYGDIASLGPLHAWTVADALYERVEAARGSARSGGSPVVIGAPLPAARPATDPPAAPGEVVEVQLAGCRGFFDSPFGSAGEGCPVSFTGCLQCRNAVITTQKLPAIVTYLHHIVSQRFVMTEDEWCEAWGADYVRIALDVLPRFDAATVERAQEKAQRAGGAGFYLPTVATARGFRDG